MKRVDGNLWRSVSGGWRSHTRMYRRALAVMSAVATLGVGLVSGPISSAVPSLSPEVAHAAEGTEERSTGVDLSVQIQKQDTALMGVEFTREITIENKGTEKAENAELKLKIQSEARLAEFSNIRMANTYVDDGVSYVDNVENPQELERPYYIPDTPSARFTLPAGKR
ncbi:hypothetical protein [Alloscardovia macacae]|uniref:Uncharacterized protein n=1 Tax=Alloscardovia macacae TaxID=1160091 RepID=A0A261F5P6_9BIFI|nr:hypothetical protein [Alloscardovia macacae]OZG54226.1 hypothetical protein ALMA_0687 [Alloscardovia macacae]